MFVVYVQNAVDIPTGCTMWLQMLLWVDPFGDVYKVSSADFENDPIIVQYWKSLPAR